MFVFSILQGAIFCLLALRKSKGKRKTDTGDVDPGGRLRRPMTLLIIGAGQYGLVAKEIAEAMKCFRKILFLDDHCEFAVGKLNEIDRVEYDAAVVAIGDPIIRKQWLIQVKNPISLIHPNANVMPSASIGEGAVIEAGAVVCSGASVGQGTFVMANAVVGHNATVGDFCQLKYNCSIPERNVVPNQTVVDCNAISCNRAEIERLNSGFIQEEISRTGAEPSFF